MNDKYNVLYVDDFVEISDNSRYTIKSLNPNVSTDFDITGQTHKIVEIEGETIYVIVGGEKILLNASVVNKVIETVCINTEYDIDGIATETHVVEMPSKLFKQSFIQSEKLATISEYSKYASEIQKSSRMLAKSQLGKAQLTHLIAYGTSDLGFTSTKRKHDTIWIYKEL